jgi:NNP family nitrate/nitrite transporter-like MFS transporter
VRRALIGGCALGLASGWNISNVGAIAQYEARAYGVGLATVGLFTTALFLVHFVMQIPGGKAADRFGARRAGLVGLAFIVVFDLVALAAPSVALVIPMRALVGVGTGIGFLAGSAYVRATGGSAGAQGIYGGVSVSAGGLALAIVPQLERLVGWRAPFVSAAAVAMLAFVLLAAAPGDEPRPRLGEVVAGVLRDRRLYRLAALYAAALGLSVVTGNWIVTLLSRYDGLGKGAAGGLGALALALGFFTRPLGGWIMRTHPARARLAVGMSLAVGAAGTALLAVATPVAVAGIGAALVGLASGIPFAPAFTGAATLRPDAPAAAVGVVNGASALVIVAGTPLLGLSFSLPGGGRAGFAVVAALWAATLLALPSREELGVTAPASELRS